MKRAYYDLWLTHQQRAILARDKQLVERLARTTEQKYGVGEATQADALRAQVELTHMAIAVQHRGAGRQTAAAELNALLSQPPDEPLGVPEDPAMEPFVGERRDADRPGTAAASGAGRATRCTSPATRAASSSRSSAGGRTSRSASAASSTTAAADGFGAMATVTLPFVYGSKYSAATAEARAKLAGAEAELRRLAGPHPPRGRAGVRTRASTAALQHSLARGTHVPQAEQALRVTEGAYQAGSADFRVAARHDAPHRRRCTSSTSRPAADLGKATADLERAVGGALPAPIAAQN